VRGFFPILISASLAVVAADLPTSRPAAPPTPGLAGPPLPPARSPIDRFRELLAATPAERDRRLAKIDPSARNLILAKVQEFQKLRPNDCEIRLRVAQLHESLRPLLNATAEERVRLMVTVPPDDKPLLDERLRAWDAMDASARRELLESESQFSWFVGQEVADRKQFEQIIAAADPVLRPGIEAQFARWSALAPDERARRAASFRRFFDLSPDERARSLGTLSDVERRQMQKALADFGTLSPDERDRCVRGFRKFADLSPAERDQFLRSAAKWRAMTPNERAAWRRLVEATQSAPPLPFAAERVGVAGNH
jgi:hypothetical protein